MKCFSNSFSVGACAVALTIGLCTVATEARADFNVYSNLVISPTPQGFAIGGATNADPQTLLVGDDIDPLAGHAGERISSFQFAFYNANLTAVSVVPTVQLYDVNAQGLPGEFLGGVQFNPITVGAQTLRIEGSGNLVADNVRLFLPVTDGGDFFAALSFSNINGATATVAQLNNIEEQVFNPPTIGSSADEFFLSSSPGIFASDNPPGGLFNFGGSPKANFGFQFSTTAPEANSGLLLGLALPALIGVVVLRRRKMATSGSSIAA